MIATHEPVNVSIKGVGPAVHRAMRSNATELKNHKPTQVTDSNMLTWQPSTHYAQPTSAFGKMRRNTSLMIRNVL